MTINLKNLCELAALWLDGSLSSGNITEFVEKLPRCSSSPLNILSLQGNNMTGMLPDVMGHINYLSILDLSNNSISGSIPRGIQNLTQLISLALSSNQLTGHIPVLPTSLTNLDVAMNFLSGNLPSQFGAPFLRVIILSYNRITLSHNMFHGNIPVNIANLGSLQYLNLAANNISGSLPRTLVNLKAMTLKHLTRIDVGWYESLTYYVLLTDILSLVMKHQELNYHAEGSFDLVGIDLSQNQLTGGIPDQVTCLDGLVNLNLSSNHLKGKIPDNVGDMKSVESLDFSRNNLSGEIPQSLSDLTYLSSLDLSHSNFVGRIPRGSQFDTLYANNLMATMVYVDLLFKGIAQTLMHQSMGNIT
uniref:Leucine-rich repeat-containing N-terminal plant-type domain-containing protein n=1 Tax=Oryza glumipatula TaxID=40148 RepID=A0A0E0BKC3_9ORYZ